jgi:aspartyl-tRNA(Asn)/glutamyl-tRNA(Gln) amidotransferase subunit A
MNHRLTIRQAARLLDGGAISSVELSSFCRTWAEAGEQVWGLNAFESFVAKEEIMDRAKASDDRRRLQESRGVLDGIPISVKANIAVSSLPLTAGSKILGKGQNEKHAVGYDADVVRRLTSESGAVLIGATSMDEFGMGSLGNTSMNADGTPRWTKNPLPLLHKITPMLQPNGAYTDEDVVALIRLSKDEIFELHEKAKDMDAGDFFSAGGSSCGSAASVSHGSALLSLGTDTGGSVRLPSAWCGVVGLKPSYGLLSRHGIVSYASSFDTVGVIANSVECTMEALKVLAQRAEPTGSLDSTYSILPEEETCRLDNQNDDHQQLSGIRIGIPSAFSVSEIPPSIREGWARTADVLRQNGATVQQLSTDKISPLLVQGALAAYYVLVSAEASSNLSRYDGFRYGVAAPNVSDAGSGLTPLEQQYAATRTSGFGPEVARRVLCGTSVLSSDRFHTHYEAAAKLRSVLARQLHNALSEDVDAILIPTALSLPPRLDTGEIDNTQMFANDIMTIPASLAGLPVVSVPIELPGEETIFKGGMSIVGPRLKETTVIRIGKALEMVKNNVTAH